MCDASVTVRGCDGPLRATVTEQDGGDQGEAESCGVGGSSPVGRRVHSVVALVGFAQAASRGAFWVTADVVLVVRVGRTAAHRRACNVRLNRIDSPTRQGGLATLLSTDGVLEGLKFQTDPTDI